MTWIFINYWISRMYEKGTFFTKRIRMRTLEVDWRIQNYFIIKWLWFYNIFVCIASLRPPRITGPGGYQMVLAYQAGPTWPLPNRKNLLVIDYYSIFISILFFLNEGSNERKNGFHGIGDSKVHAHYFWQSILKTTRLEFSNAKPLILALLPRVIDFHLETSYCEKIKSSSIEVDWGQFGKQVYSYQLEPRGWFQLTV